MTASDHPDSTGTQSTDTLATDTLVVGAGASGLATAYALAREGKRVTVLEAGDQPGGNIRSHRDDQWQIEIGPNTLMVKQPLFELLEELDLAETAIFAGEAGRKRYVAQGKQLIALPSNPLAAPFNPLVGPGTLLRLMREPWVRRAAHEESLADFVQRRLGRNVLENLVDPFVSGVYAGDPARLSVQAAMPKLAAMEREHGSLIRGGFAAMKHARQQRRDGTDSLPPAWRGKLLSFPDGIQTLTDRLAERITASPGGEIVCGRRIETVTGGDGGWRVTDAEGQQWQARHLVLATPAHVSAELLRPVDPLLAEPLDEIVYPPVASVALGFPTGMLAHPLDGFGVLLPRNQKRRTLGALFSSTLFPHRAPTGHKLITAFIGGRQDPEAVDMTDAELVRQVTRDLGDLLGIEGEPVWQRVSRWPKAIPQYELGHLARIERLDQALAAHSQLSLIGNWRDGIAVGDCLENGRALGERLLADD
ncbi:protoporphyrinogen oxidase [Guyparkeria hydrothermalis]|uniref:protoporphyrinogen oxidase n=1 Tax=Guyparkeria hydrothermalis TaxID=923 RepID=UPI0020213041|nr:protoporphyrinogen oxidase [Guyparkeria hydrothermalis]MCL7745450.1 protoporphyrinogen oxidase [Guyparkeria hydrothermalis]